MKKITKSDFYNYPMSRLFKEDIVEIFEIFKNHCQRVEIQIGDYELESIEELKDVPLRRTSNIFIKGRNPYVTLEFKNSSTRLYLSDTGDTSLRGIKSLIDEIIGKRKFVFNFIFSNNIGIFLTGAFFSQLYFSYLRLIPPKNIIDYSIDVLLVIPLLIFIYSTYYYSVKQYCVIYLKSSKHDLSFLERNFDKISSSALRHLNLRVQSF